MVGRGCLPGDSARHSARGCVDRWILDSANASFVSERTHNPEKNTHTECYTYEFTVFIHAYRAFSTNGVHTNGKNIIHMNLLNPSKQAEHSYFESIFYINRQIIVHLNILYPCKQAEHLADVSIACIPRQNIIH